MLHEKIYIQFSRHWGVSIETVSYIEILLRTTGNRYGKVSRTLRKTGIVISTRQLKYFRGRKKLAERLGDLRPKNWSELLRKF